MSKDNSVAMSIVAVPELKWPIESEPSSTEKDLAIFNRACLNPMPSNEQQQLWVNNFLQDVECHSLTHQLNANVISGIPLEDDIEIFQEDPIDIDIDIDSLSLSIQRKGKNIGNTKRMRLFTGKEEPRTLAEVCLQPGTLWWYENKMNLVRDVLQLTPQENFKQSIKVFNALRKDMEYRKASLGEVDP